jgi:hypothetical protein
MATIENVLSLAGAMDEGYFIGSMIPEPASGWPYFDALQRLESDAGADPKTAAVSLVEAYAGSVDAQDWCMVALDLKKAADLRVALRALFGTTAPSALEVLDAASGASLPDDTDLIDLGAFLRRLDHDGTRPLATSARGVLIAGLVARRAAGTLRGRDGLAVRLALPPALPATPGWFDYLPDLAPLVR